MADDKVSEAKKVDDDVLPHTPRYHLDADGALYAPEFYFLNNTLLFLIFIKSAEKVSDAREGDDGVLTHTPRSLPDADGALYALLLMR